MFLLLTGDTGMSNQDMFREIILALRASRDRKSEVIVKFADGSAIRFYKKWNGIVTFKRLEAT